MTNAELAILTLVAERPIHGYAIERAIEERGMREWTEIGFSSIYYLLNKLEKAGYVESYIEPAAGNGPARKTYRITDAGRQAQAAAAYRTLAEPGKAPMPFLLGLANLPVLPPEQAVAALGSHRQQLVARRQHLRQRRDEQPGAPSHVVAMFDYSLRLIEAEIEWLDEFMQRLEEKANAKS